MPHDALVHHVESSNLPAHDKSKLRAWFERSGGHHMAHRAKGHVVEGAHTIRAVGEGAVVGALLGAADASLAGGLDFKASASLPAIPLDGALAVVATVGAVALAHDGVAADLRNAASSAAAIFAFRKTGDLVRAQQGKSSMHGEFAGEGTKGEDLVVACAKLM